MNQPQKQIKPIRTEAKIIEMDNRNAYLQNGYEDREHYLKCMADDYGVDMYSVSSLAEILGEEEDFDGLISTLNDFSYFL